MIHQQHIEAQLTATKKTVVVPSLHPSVPSRVVPVTRSTPTIPHTGTVGHVGSTAPNRVGSTTPIHYTSTEIPSRPHAATAPIVRRWVPVVRLAEKTKPVPRSLAGSQGTKGKTSRVYLGAGIVADVTHENILVSLWDWLKSIFGYHHSTIQTHKGTAKIVPTQANKVVPARLVSIQGKARPASPKEQGPIRTNRAHNPSPASNPDPSKDGLFITPVGNPRVGYDKTIAVRSHVLTGSGQ